ncbi:MAG: AAA family ATPase [[Clostridium] innocuum]
MKQTLILLAGYPGTGKSYLAELLMKQFTGFEILSPDEIKEEFWDAYGFRNEQEKEELIQKSWVEYYHRMEWKFTRGISLLSDYPFSHKQHDQLQEVCDKHHVQIITIRMIADLDVLFERQKKRDLDTSRHLGHILKKYHKGICLKCHEEADNLLDYDEFIQRCTCRGYGTFALGTTLQLDVTDFATAPYDELMIRINELLEF